MRPQMVHIAAALAVVLAFPAATAARTYGDGTHSIRTMPPGTYATEGGEGCYWARLSGFGGTLDEIIANDMPQGPTIVTIEPTDAGFETSGCGYWSLVDGPTTGETPAPPVTTPADGSWETFLLRNLYWADRIIEDLPDRPAALRRFTRGLADEMMGFLAGHVPQDCYRDAYVAAWRAAVWWDIIAELSGSDATKDLEAFAALYGGPAMTRATTDLQQSIGEATCTD